MLISAFLTRGSIFLIDIFDSYNKIHKDSYLFIVGDGELSDDLNRYIDSKKSKDKIIRINAVKSTEKMYSAFDTFFEIFFDDRPV